MQNITLSCRVIAGLIASLTMAAVLAGTAIAGDACSGQAGSCHASHQVPYVGLLLASRHIGRADLEDVTPGLTFGRRGPLGSAAHPRSPEWHAEAGIFRNSYGETSPIALAGLSYRVADLGALGRLRLGASVGVARYSELAGELEESHGVPNIDGFIPIAAATIALRRERTDIRISTVPPGEDVTAILNLSLAVRF